MAPKRQPDKVLTEEEWEALVLSEDLKDYIKPDGTLDLDAIADDAINWDVLNTGEQDPT